MNAYIEDCIKQWVKMNAWFFRILAHEFVNAVKEAVEVCRND